MLYHWRSHYWPRQLQYFGNFPCDFEKGLVLWEFWSFLMLYALPNYKSYQWISRDYSDSNFFFISPLSKKNCWMIKVSKLRGKKQERGVNGTSLLMKSFFKALSPIWFLKLWRQRKTIATLSSTLNLIIQCASCIKFNGLMYFLVLGMYISYCHSGLFLFYVHYLYYIKIVMFTLSTSYFLLY